MDKISAWLFLKERLCKGSLNIWKSAQILSIQIKFSQIFAHATTSHRSKWRASPAPGSLAVITYLTKATTVPTSAITD